MKKYKKTNEKTIDYLIRHSKSIILISTMTYVLYKLPGEIENGMLYLWITFFILVVLLFEWSVVDHLAEIKEEIKKKQ